MISHDTLIWTAELMREAAEAEIMPWFRKLDDEDIQQKTSSIDLVTQADIMSEKLMTARIKEHFPDALAVGEEAYADDASILDGLATAALAFVLDPVDGTFNFARGVPLFGVMCAIVEHGVATGGIIYDPVGRNWLYARRGEGAFMRWHDGSTKAIGVAAPAAIGEMGGASSWYYLQPDLKRMVLRNMENFKTGFGFRCAAHEYWLAATGGCHFVMYAKLNPWDHLAGSLIHQEAGGYHARFDGSAYDCTTRDGGLLLAPDQDSWQRIHDTLFAEAP
ncbi:MAG: inositol monophosphatase family protein [Pseudomonadota bacterium]